MKQGQAGIRDMLIEIKGTINCINDKQVTVRLNAAQEKTKSGVLYWVLGAAGMGLILGVANLVLKGLGLWR